MRTFPILLGFALMTFVILGLQLTPFAIEASTISATVDIKPDTLNLKMKGQRITVYIEFPKPWNAKDIRHINVSTVRLEVIPAELHPMEIGDYDSDRNPDLMVKFDTSSAIDYIWSKIYHLAPAPLKEHFIELTVSGELYDGTPFKGSDIIRIIHIEE